MHLLRCKVFAKASIQGDTAQGKERSLSTDLELDLDPRSSSIERSSPSFTVVLLDEVLGF